MLHVLVVHRCTDNGTKNVPSSETLLSKRRQRIHAYPYSIHLGFVETVMADPSTAMVAHTDDRHVEASI